MGTLPSVLAARIWERVGVEAVSMTESAIQYRPCFLPPPSLITSSVSSSFLVGSHSGPWTDLPASVYSERRECTLALVYASGGSLGL